MEYSTNLVGMIDSWYYPGAAVLWQECLKFIYMPNDYKAIVCWFHMLYKQKASSCI